MALVRRKSRGDLPAVEAGEAMSGFKWLHHEYR